MSDSTKSSDLQTTEDFSRHMTKNKISSQTTEVKSKCKRLEHPVESTVVEIVEPRRTKSFPECPNCNRKGIFKRSKLFAKTFTRWNLEMKLNHYKIEYAQSMHPLNFLKKHFTSAGVSGNTIWKFNPNELSVLHTMQLRKLKGSLEEILQYRNKELKEEMEEREILTSNQQTLKKQSTELESLAREVMKPYINIHPLCEELARLMLA